MLSNEKLIISWHLKFNQFDKWILEKKAIDNPWLFWTLQVFIIRCFIYHLKNCVQFVWAFTQRWAYIYLLYVSSRVHPHCVQFSLSRYSIQSVDLTRQVSQSNYKDYILDECRKAVPFLLLSQYTYNRLNITLLLSLYKTWLLWRNYIHLYIYQVNFIKPYLEWFFHTDGCR